MSQSLTVVSRCYALCILASFAAPAVLSSQCVTTPVSCRDFLTIGEGSARALVYRTHPLHVPNQSIRQALVVIHGAERAARFEFRSALAGAFLAGVIENTLIVLPRFTTDDGRSCTDSVATNELNFNCDVLLRDWRVGGSAINNPALSAFDVVDAILLTLARKDLFPNLRSIVVAGHSAGGQFVTLYQTANTVHDRLGVPVSYVVANASAYAYVDDRRPIVSMPNATAAAEGNPQPTRFGPLRNATECSTYSDWPFGLANRHGYASRFSDVHLRQQATRRSVTYLLGERDTSPPGGFFGSCAGIAQGSTRLARGIAFATYMSEAHGAQHKAIVVEDCGHDARCIYTADQALPALFPKQP
jgi:hypothetical protein